MSYRTVRPRGLVLALVFCFLPLLSGATEQITLSLSLGKPMILPVREVNYLKIGLAGLVEKMAKTRAPVNLAIVLDKSGSMQGEKLRHAKRAAMMAIERLNSDDIVSIVAYDSEVEVLVPATKARDKEMIFRAIESLEAGSNTALFAGVSKGAREVRKFHDRKRVNRIILLSDGLANEGPSSTEELGTLGASLGREGISVTTFGLGLGYNEDLMMQLARQSDGNHAFIERPEELARTFDLEFGDILNVVAQDVEIEIILRNARILRILGREATIRDDYPEGKFPSSFEPRRRSVFSKIGQLCGNQEKYVLLEIENEPELKDLPSFDVKVSYTDALTGARQTRSGHLEAKLAKDENEARSSENREVMVSAVTLLANENYKVATRLRDEGKVEEARRALETNRDFLRSNAERLQSPALQGQADQNMKDATNLDDESWNKTRKNMRKIQHTNEMQQTY